AWRLRLMQSRARDQRGLPRNASSPYHEAVRQIEAIASEIEDRDMKDSYLKTPERAFATPTSKRSADAARRSAAAAARTEPISEQPIEPSITSRTEPSTAPSAAPSTAPRTEPQESATRM